MYDSVYTAALMGDKNAQAFLTEYSAFDPMYLIIVTGYDDTELARFTVKTTRAINSPGLRDLILNQCLFYLGDNFQDFELYPYQGEMIAIPNLRPEHNA